MTPTLLQTVLRRATRLMDDPTAPGASDADLLRRFADDRDESAFQSLLDRHGPLAWAVCRQMLSDPTDAEDAFQATFLALVQSADKLGRVKSVGGWLHGVAVKVCLKVRRSAVRRKGREERSAKPEAATDTPQWDDLHAAVHEEVERLPATLRAVFVLCELEGVRQPEAAVKLGCKLGTLSARLTRARQALLKSLTARGLTPAVAVGTVAIGSSASAVPLVLVEKAVMLARGGTDAGLAVPSSVLKLAKSVTEGTLMKTKLMVAAGIAAAGMMLTAAGGWGTADAQDPPPAREAVRPNPQPEPRPAPRPRTPVAEPEEPQPPPPSPRPRTRPPVVDPTDPIAPEPPLPPRPPRGFQPPEPTAPRSVRGPQQRMEHEVFDVPGSKNDITKLIRKQEAAGWEFAGQAGEGRTAILVFKRPKGMPPGARGGQFDPLFDPRATPVAPQPPRGRDAFVPAPDNLRPPTPRRDSEPRDPRRGDEFQPRRAPDPLPPDAPLVAPRRSPADLPMSGEYPLPVGGTGPLTPAYPGPDTGVPTQMPSDSLVPQRMASPTPEAIPAVMIPPVQSPMLIPAPQRRSEPDAAIHVIELKHATPRAMSIHIEKFFGVEVSADEESNSLVIRCGKKTLTEVKELVEKLDKPAKSRGASLPPTSFSR